MTLSLAFVALLGCGPSAPPPSGPTPEDPARAAEADAIARAGSASTALLGSLRDRLTSVMAAEGPVAAAAVCADEAQVRTAEIAAGEGARLGRASLRLRNPRNAPPPWVQAWLTARGERSAEGVTGVSEVVVEVDGRRVARHLAPIAVGAPCLACHGPKEGLAPEVSALLAEHYPEDRGVGYAVGDLRGAVWAEVPVAAATGGR